MSYGGEQTLPTPGWTGAAGRADEPLESILNRILPLRYQIDTEDTSTGVTAGTAETIFVNKLTIPGGCLKKGDRIRIRGKTKVLTKHSTDTMRLRLRIGGLAGLMLADVPAYNASNSDGHELEAWLRVSSITAGGGSDRLQLVGVGKTLKTGGTALLASTDIDDDTSLVAASDQDLVLTYAWSVSDAGNQVRIKELEAVVFRTRQAWG